MAVVKFSNALKRTIMHNVEQEFRRKRSKEISVYQTPQFFTKIHSPLFTQEEHALALTYPDLVTLTTDFALDFADSKYSILWSGLAPHLYRKPWRISTYSNTAQMPALKETHPEFLTLEALHGHLSALEEDERRITEALTGIFALNISLNRVLEKFSFVGDYLDTETKDRLNRPTPHKRAKALDSIVDEESTMAIIRSRMSDE